MHLRHELPDVVLEKPVAHVVQVIPEVQESQLARHDLHELVEVSKYWLAVH